MWLYNSFLLITVAAFMVLELLHTGNASLNSTVSVVLCKQRLWDGLIPFQGVLPVSIGFTVSGLILNQNRQQHLVYNRRKRKIPSINNEHVYHYTY
jgi:hypothetical protein